MSFSKRLLELRKQHKFSQGELALKAGIHSNVLGRYERGEANPSIEVATKLSDVLGVSLDYLVGKTDMLLDNNIVDKILTIQQLPTEDKEHILFTLEAMLRDAKARATYAK